MMAQLALKSPYFFLVPKFSIFTRLWMSAVGICWYVFFRRKYKSESQGTNCVSSSSKDTKLKNYDAYKRYSFFEERRSFFNFLVPVHRSVLHDIITEDKQNMFLLKHNQRFVIRVVHFLGLFKLVLLKDDIRNPHFSIAFWERLA